MRDAYHYEVGYVTDAGNVRAANQDSLLIRRGSLDGSELMLLAVADGMGGLSHGEEASLLAVHTLNTWWNEQLPGLLAEGLAWRSLESSLAVAIDQIDWTLCAGGDEGRGKSGTTLTLAFLYRREFCLLQVGDSRCYRLSGGTVEQLTRDQTWCQQELDAGRLTAEEAAAHPMRHVLVSTLGVSSGFTLERSMGKLDFDEGLLLCSDGFYAEMDIADFAPLARGEGVQTVLDRAQSTICAGTAEDNLTAVLVRLNRGKRA